MTRVLTILAAIAALAVTAAPVASAGTSKKPPSPTFLDQPQPVTSFTSGADLPMESLSLTATSKSRLKAPRRGTASYAVKARTASAGLLSSPLGVSGFIMGDGRICNPRWGC